MPRLQGVPGHQQSWYWLYKLSKTLSFTRKDVNYLCYLGEEKVHENANSFQFLHNNLAGNSLISFDEPMQTFTAPRLASPITVVALNSPVRGLLWLLEVQMSRLMPSTIWLLDSSPLDFFPRRITENTACGAAKNFGQFVVIFFIYTNIGNPYGRGLGSLLWRWKTDQYLPL